MANWKALGTVMTIAGGVLTILGGIANEKKQEEQAEKRWTEYIERKEKESR